MLSQPHSFIQQSTRWVQAKAWFHSTYDNISLHPQKVQTLALVAQERRGWKPCWAQVCKVAERQSFKVRSRESDGLLHDSRFQRRDSRSVECWRDSKANIKEGKGNCGIRILKGKLKRDWRGVTWYDIWTKVTNKRNYIYILARVHYQSLIRDLGI